MERECPKGWILVPSPTDGEYVPYFVQVRNKDIIWNEKVVFPNDIIYRSGISNNKNINYADSVISCDYDKWHLRLHKDSYCEATTIINIGLTDSIRFNVTPNKIEFKLYFPGSFKYDNNSLNISIIPKSNLSSLQTANISMINPDTLYGNEEWIQATDISIINYAFPFDINWVNNHTYNDSYLYIKITGYIDVSPPR